MSSNDISDTAVRRAVPLLVRLEAVRKQGVVEAERVGCVQNEHIDAPGILPAVKAVCVQNEHKADQKRPVVMSGHRMLVCLLTIGWSERQFARKAHQHQTTVTRWVERGLDDPELAASLEALAAAHQANPLIRSTARAIGSGG